MSSQCRFAGYRVGILAGVSVANGVRVAVGAGAGGAGTLASWTIVTDPSSRFVT